ncbi:MAG: UDP-N-acetylglucosamine 1-carboxyvinyltransferase [Clostridia bacterium]|nr:UDP-N-acetylglucosamine 1-carboxyvinyltransferase [Clostridia bacterium]
MNTYNDKLMVVGGNELNGEATIQTSKNAVLPILAGCVLCDKPIVIKNVPNLLDVHNMFNILKGIGVSIDCVDKDCYIDASNITSTTLNQELCKALRSSIFLLGPMLARTRQAVISYPGGCDIGNRPIDLHLSGLEKLGVKIIKRHSLIYCDARNMHSATIQLDFPSVGATENLMMASVFLKGTTRLINVAKEPEIVDLQNFLNSMGCNISGAGSAEITITGVDKLHSTQYMPIGDRIVAGTLMIATAITGGKVALKNTDFKNNQSLIAKLSSVGCQIDIKSDIIYISSKGRLPSVDLIDTQVYPGFPTDMQAQMMSLQAVSDGVSIMCENVFENRYKHAKELIKMGANIILRDRVAVVKGVKELTGAPVDATDLRAGAGLVLAGLKANGYTTVNNAYYIDRGYEQFENLLSSLGANIKRI